MTWQTSLRHRWWRPNKNREVQKMNEQSTVDEAETSCTACMTIPVSHVSIEDGISVPIGGWAATFESMNIKTVVDPAGRLAISTLAARRLFAASRRDAEWRAETAAANYARVAAEHPIPTGGVPAQEGMTPFESMVAAGGIVTPEQEFGGRPRPNFLKEEILAGERAQEEDRRVAAARAAARLVDQAKDKLR